MLLDKANHCVLLLSLNNPVSLLAGLADGTAGCTEGPATVSCLEEPTEAFFYMRGDVLGWNQNNSRLAVMHADAMKSPIQCSTTHGNIAHSQVNNEMKCVCPRSHILGHSRRC